MIKERELLRRALDEWDSNDSTLSDVDRIMEGIRAHLAAEEGKQEEEPVAYIQRDQLQKAMRSPMLCAVSPEPREDRVGFFLHPSPQSEQRRPLSGEEIMAALSVDAVDGFQHGFWSGVRWAEKMHGIGGKDE